MTTKTKTARYNFELLERRRIKECFETGGAAALREFSDALRNDAETLARLAEAIEGGESYDISPDQICTWWGWG